MARSPRSWPGRLAVGSALVALLGSAAAPAAQAASAATGIRVLTLTAGDTAALEQAYAAGRHIPLGAVGAIRAGSALTAEDGATGAHWAVASFLPAAGAAAEVRISFQDGAAKGVFVESPGSSWELVRSAGPVGCGSAIPAAVKDALGLASVDCDAGTAQPGPAALAKAADPQDLGSSIADIALGQVGLATTPAETSFNGVDCDPYSTMDAAFSPNADGCGADPVHQVENQNEEWCSDFAKWVWSQAGVTADMNTLNAGANSFYAWALDQGETPVADTGTPQPGDAVLFYSPGPITASSFADHVGVVSGVNSDGTVNIVNGDFLGASGITVEYDQDVDLTSWAAAIWGQGEQWMLVAPPAAPQQPVPGAAIIAPPTAVAGTAVDLHAVAAEPGGSIAQYYWTFNDGRTNNTTGASVSHVFQRAGLYTVTMSATSNFGTVTTKTWNIGVGAGPSTISSVPDNSVWYTTDPVKQYEFTRSGSGALAVDSWDGASWLQQAEPGLSTPDAGLTGLTYSDPAAGDAIAPHAYYRSTDGTLGETYLGANGWTAATLPGQPAADSAIAALASDPASGVKPGLTVTPSVFFFDGSGGLDESTASGTTWSTSAVAGASSPDPRSLAVAETAGILATDYVFYLGADGRLAAAWNLGGTWRGTPIPTGLGVQPGSPLAAASPAPGQVDLFFIDAKGSPAVATSKLPGLWSVHEIPGAPAAGTALTATNDLNATGAAGDEVFYLTASGTPAVTSGVGSAWQTSTLPGTATSIQGVSTSAGAGAAQQLFVSDGAQLGVDASGAANAAGAAWDYSALPSTPTTYPGTVLLYAATATDDASALAAASYAGLPATQVTTDFATAWAATLSGDYLVLAVGQAAVSALYDNPCGWANPSADDPGSTPFDNVNRPLNVTLTDLFLVAAAATAAQTPQRAADMAYYAVHGALPAGATLPTVASPGHTCLGQPS